MAVFMNILDMMRDAQSVGGVARLRLVVSTTPKFGGYLGVFPHFTPTSGTRRQRGIDYPIVASGVVSLTPFPR
jgi:hypothetical protein